MSGVPVWIGWLLWTCSDFKFSVCDSLELSGIQFTLPKRTRHRQDSFVVSGVALWISFNWVDLFRPVHVSSVPFICSEQTFIVSPAGLCRKRRAYSHIIMYVGLFGHSAVVFHVFNVFFMFLSFTDCSCLCFFQSHFIDLFSCIAASLFNQLTYLLTDKVSSTCLVSRRLGAWFLRSPLWLSVYILYPLGFTTLTLSVIADCLFCP